MERIVCVAVGYIFGLFQTGYLYGKIHHMDIRKQGSGNAGTTNALRTMGWKAGVITLLGDSLKCLLAVTVVHLIYGNTHGDIMPVLSLYTGMGAVLGHNYPFYMKFKGGKGIAVTVGLIVSTVNIYLMLGCFAMFFLVVAVTQYVSVGSLAMVLVYMAEIFVCGHLGMFGMKPPYIYEMYGIAVLLTVSAFYKHKANIRRLLDGTENKLSLKKKK